MERLERDISLNFWSLRFVLMKMMYSVPYAETQIYSQNRFYLFLFKVSGY